MRIFKDFELGIVVSEHDKQIFNKICPNGNYIVIENGVEIEKLSTINNNLNDNRLVWLGGFGHYSNIEAVQVLLTKIYPLIKTEISNVALDIIGGNPPDKIKKMCETDASITLLGYVDDPIPYLQKAAVFVMPIFSGGGTKLKALEAMAVGKAIVSTKLGCEGICGVDGVHYLTVDNLNEFASTVIKLLRDKDMRINLGRNAR